MANLHAFGDKIMGGASTGGGHTIWNRIKTALTQRSKLWFKDATVSDVSADGASAVEVLTSISESDFDNLATDGTADGIYEMNSSNVTPLMADNIGLGSVTVKDGIANIAHIQDTLTADKAYNVGDQFIYNGLLYKATSAIASGGTITVGTNCALSSSVTEQIGTRDVPITWIISANARVDNFFSIRRSGNVICISWGMLQFINAMTANAWTHIFTIDNSEDMPPVEIRSAAFYGQNTILVKVAPDGKCSINPQASVPAYFSLSATSVWIQ